MPEVCAVPGCKSNYPSSIKREGSVTSFRFPQDASRRQQWVRAIRRLDWTPHKSARICIKHFSENDLCLTEKYKDQYGIWREFKRLKPILSENAVPTLLPNLSDTKSSKKKSPEERRQKKAYRSKKKQQDEDIRRAIKNEVGDNDSLCHNSRSKKNCSGSGKKKPRKAKAKKGNAAPPETATSNSSDFNLSQDGSSSRPDDQFICEASTSSATRTFTEVNIKHEGIKEELILEDYTNPSDMMEFTTTEGVEDNSKVQGDTSAESVQSSSASAGGTFETIICGGDIKIKQEIFEDECDAVESTWAGTTENESSDPFSSAAPQCVLPTATASANVSPDMEVKLRTPLNKSLKQVPKSKVKGSGKMKAIPVSSVLKCQICVNEFFLSPSDLMEHCILKHSDASDRFLSAVDPSSQQPSIASGPPGQSSSVASTQDFSTAKPEFSAATQTGYSGTNPPDFNVTKPGPLVSNMPGQPPKNIIPPYISSCDVFDGVYVSLSQISADKRKATRNKILELVKFLSESNVNPEEVNFVIMGK